MNPETLEAIRAFAQFAGGALVGFLVSQLTTYMSARTRVLEAVLTEAEKAERARAKPAPTRADRVLPFIVILLMVAMLLAGLSWFKSGQDDAENRRRDCLRSAENSRVLRGRTQNYLEAATSERALWVDLRKQLRRMGSRPHSPLVESIDDYLDAQDAYLKHLRRNPITRESEEDC